MRLARLAATASPEAVPGTFATMRVDRELSTKVFHPLHRARFWDRGLRIPILSYHSISNDPEPGVAPAARIATDPFVFRQQMRLLITAGCNPADLTQLISWLRDGVRPPDRTVVLTFNNGLRDFHINAFPVLQEHSFPATVFLPTDFIGASRNWFNKRETLNWPEVREMRKAGIRFGSQSVTTRTWPNFRASMSCANWPCQKPKSNGNWAIPSPLLPILAISRTTITHLSANFASCLPRPVIRVA